MNPKGVWQLRRIGGPASVQNSSSLIILKEEGSVSVGRGPKADFFLDSAVTSRLISRVHALVTGRMGKDGTPSFTIINNGLNGTYINDVKMGYRSTNNEQALREGDKITFGHPGCASIEAGEYAPQDNSEFMFIFECVAARGEPDVCYYSKTARSHSITHSTVHTTQLKHTVLPRSTENTHVSRYQHTRRVNTGSDLLHSPQNNFTGSKVTGSDSGPESPKSSASSEKENDGRVGKVGSTGPVESSNGVHDSRLEPTSHGHQCKCLCIAVAPGSGKGAKLTGIRCTLCDGNSKSSKLYAAWKASGTPYKHISKTLGVGLPDSAEHIPACDDEDVVFVSVCSRQAESTRPEADSHGLSPRVTSLNNSHGCSPCPPPHISRNVTPMSCDENYVSSTNQSRTPDRGGASGCHQAPPHGSDKQQGDQQAAGCGGSEVNSTTLISGEDQRDNSDESDLEIDVINVDDDPKITVDRSAKDRPSSPVVEFLGETGPTMPLRMVTPPDMFSVEKATSDPVSKSPVAKTDIPSTELTTTVPSTEISPKPDAIVSKGPTSKDKKATKGRKKALTSGAILPAIFPVCNQSKKTMNVASSMSVSVGCLKQNLNSVKTTSSDQHLTTVAITKAISSTASHPQRGTPSSAALQQPDLLKSVPSNQNYTSSSAISAQQSTPMSAVSHEQNALSSTSSGKGCTLSSAVGQQQITVPSAVPYHQSILSSGFSNQQKALCLSASLQGNAHSITMSRSQTVVSSVVSQSTFSLPVSHQSCTLSSTMSNSQNTTSTTVSHQQSTPSPSLPYQQNTQSAIVSFNQSISSSTVSLQQSTLLPVTPYKQKAQSPSLSRQENAPCSTEPYPPNTQSSDVSHQQGVRSSVALHEQNSLKPEKTRTQDTQKPSLCSLKKNSEQNKGHTDTGSVPITCASSHVSSLNEPNTASQPSTSKFSYQHTSHYNNSADPKGNKDDCHPLHKVHGRSKLDAMDSLGERPYATGRKRRTGNKRQKTQLQGVKKTELGDQSRNNHAFSQHTPASPTVNETVVKLSSPRPSSSSSMSSLSSAASAMDASTEVHLSHSLHQHLHYSHRQHHRRKASPSSGSAASSRSSSEASLDRYSLGLSRNGSVQSSSQASVTQHNGGSVHNSRINGMSVSDHHQQQTPRCGRQNNAHPSATNSKAEVRGPSQAESQKGRGLSLSPSPAPSSPRRAAYGAARSPSQSSEASVASSTTSNSSSSSASSSGSSASSSSSSSMSSSSSSSTSPKPPGKDNLSASVTKANTEKTIHTDTVTSRSWEKEGNEGPKPCLTLERRLHTRIDDRHDKENLEGKRRDEGGGGTVDDTVKNKKRGNAIMTPERKQDEEKAVDLRLEKEGGRLEGERDARKPITETKGDNEGDKELQKAADNTLPRIDNKARKIEGNRCTCNKEKKHPKDYRGCEASSHRAERSSAENYRDCNHARYTNKVRSEMDAAEMARLARSSTIIVDTSQRSSSPASSIVSEAASLSSLSSDSSSSSTSSSSTAVSSPCHSIHKSQSNPQALPDGETRKTFRAREEYGVAKSSVSSHRQKDQNMDHLPQSLSQSPPRALHGDNTTCASSAKTFSTVLKLTESSAKSPPNLSATTNCLGTARASMSQLSVEVTSSASSTHVSSDMANAPLKVSPSSLSPASSTPMSSPTSKETSTNRKKRSILPPKKYIPQMFYSPEPHKPTGPISTASHVSTSLSKSPGIKPKLEHLSPKTAEVKGVAALDAITKPSSVISEHVVPSPLPSSSSSPSSSKKTCHRPPSPLTSDSDKSGSPPSSPIIPRVQSTPPPLEVGPCEMPPRRSRVDLLPPKLEPEFPGPEKPIKESSESQAFVCKQERSHTLKQSSPPRINSSFESADYYSAAPCRPEKPASKQVSSLSKAERQIKSPRKKLKHSSKQDQNVTATFRPSQEVYSYTDILSSSPNPLISLPRLSEAQLRQAGNSPSYETVNSPNSKTGNSSSYKNHSDVTPAIKCPASAVSISNRHQHLSESSDAEIKRKGKSPGQSKHSCHSKKNIASFRTTTTSTSLASGHKQHHNLQSPLPSTTPTISLFRLSDDEVREAQHLSSNRKYCNGKYADNVSSSAIPCADKEETVTSQRTILSPPPLSTTASTSRTVQDKHHHNYESPTSSPQSAPYFHKHINCKTRPFPSKVQQTLEFLEHASHPHSPSSRSDPIIANSNTKTTHHSETTDVTQKKKESHREKATKVSSLMTTESSDFKTKSSINNGEVSTSDRKTTSKPSKQAAIDIAVKHSQSVSNKIKSKKIAKTSGSDSNFSKDHKIVQSQPSEQLESSNKHVPHAKPTQKSKKPEQFPACITQSKDSEPPKTGEVSKKDLKDTASSVVLENEKPAVKLPLKKNLGPLRKLVSNSDHLESQKSASQRLSLFESLEIQAQQAKVQRKKVKKSDKQSGSDQVGSYKPSLADLLPFDKQKGASKSKSKLKKRQRSPIPRRSSSRSSGRLSAASILSDEPSTMRGRRGNRRVSSGGGTPAKKKRKIEGSSSRERNSVKKSSAKEGAEEGQVVRTKAKAKAAAVTKKSLAQKESNVQENKSPETQAVRKGQKRKMASQSEELESKEKSSPSKKVQKQREEQQQEKKKAAKKKTAPKSKRKKRAMTFSSGDDDEEDENNLSEDESELDDIVDNIENYNSVEDEAESEEWDLPNGVNYDDTPCSAPRCKNPVGERVDWVMCDACEQWYHVACINCSLDQLEDDNIQFHCGFC